MKKDEIYIPVAESDLQKLLNNKILDFSKKTKGLVKILVDKPRSNDTVEFMMSW